MKLVVFCPNWVGDVVMATPTLRALRKTFSDACITGVMRPYVAETLDGNPWLDDVVLYDHKSADASQRTWAVLRTLRDEHFDTGVLLTNSMRSALLAWLGKVKRRFGYARDGRGLLLTDRLSYGPLFRGRKPSPVIDDYLRLAYEMGAAEESYRMELFTTEADQRRADRLWEEFGIDSAESVAALNPGAAFGPAKRWPSPYFSELARRLVDDFPVKVVVLCGPKERGFARFIATTAARPRQVFSLADQEVSIGLSKAIVQRSRLMVTTDSGPRHFAAAFGVPVVSLFGPTHIQWTVTYFPGETTLQKDVSCGPCQQRICPLGHHRCMKELTMDEVYVAAAAKLAHLDEQRKAG